MLFVLTGDVQTGKTRWLERLIGDLGAQGVVCAGVLAPGVWRQRTDEEMALIRAGKVDASSMAIRLGSAGPYEKLGIDNVLLPEGERIVFARRRDLAQETGVFDEGSQSARVKLGWEIDDAAIGRVNAHFDELARAEAEAGSCAEGAVMSERVVRAGDDARGEGASSAKGEAARLLVVDELGRLELLGNAGLTSAMALLERGLAARYPHALVVVRAWLVDTARERFEGAWGPLRAISPDDAGRAAVAEAFNVTL